MRGPLLFASVYVGLTVGVSFGYMISKAVTGNLMPKYLEELVTMMEIPKSIDLRGHVISFDAVRKVITLNVVSPYSPSETIPLSLSLEDTTVVPPTLLQTIKEGVRVKVRIKRVPGPLRLETLIEKETFD